MVKVLLESLKKQLEEAESALEELNTLIEVAAEAGEDVSEMVIKRDELKTRIERWKAAIEKRLKP